MRLQEAIDDMRALYGERGVRELLYVDYQDNDLIQHSSVLVDDLNDQYREETALT